MTYRHQHRSMGVLNRMLLILFLVVNTMASLILGVQGYLIPDPEGMLWMAIAGFLGIITWCIILVDSQNPHGVL